MKDQEHADGHDSPAGPTDYYRLLRVDPDAPHELVAEAYGYLASRLRAEKLVRRSAERELAALNSAYQVLAAAEQRRAYDATVSRVLKLRRERADRAEQSRRRPLLARLLKKPPRRSQVDYYELLRVDRDAEPPLVARAYSILRTLHSKKATGEASKEYLSDLAQARTVLLNRERRAAYDESRIQPAPAPEAKPAKVGRVSMNKLTKIRTKRTNYRLITKIELLILAVCSVIGVLHFVNIPPSLKDAIALATSAKPETFTELYFEDHLSLPSKITYYEDNRFTFTIHNLENKDMDYPYEVYVDVNGERQIIEKASVFVESGEYKTIDEDFTITLPTARAEVVVNLMGKNQQIDFWIG